MASAPSVDGSEPESEGSFSVALRTVRAACDRLADAHAQELASCLLTNLRGTSHANSTCSPKFSVQEETPPTSDGLALQETGLFPLSSSPGPQSPSTVHVLRFSPRSSRACAVASSRSLATEYSQPADVPLGSPRGMGDTPKSFGLNGRHPDGDDVSLSTRHLEWFVKEEWAEASGSEVAMSTSQAMAASIFLVRSKRTFAKRMPQVLTSLSSQALPTSWEVLHPQSLRRMSWDFVTLLFVMYDLFATPLEVFVLPHGSISLSMNWVVTCVWTFDILMSLNTAVHTRGELVVDRKAIVAHYVSGWFSFDVALVLQAWATQLSSSRSGLLAGLRGLRVFRMLRLMRLLRIVKVARVMKDVLLQANSMLLSQTIMICQFCLTLLAINHIVACVWFYIGRYASSASEESWMRSPGQEDGTVDVQYYYLTSMHWSLCQFHGSMEVHPRNTRERAFAICVAFGACVTFPFFISMITGNIFRLQEVHKERSARLAGLCSFLQARDVSAELSILAKRYLDSYAECMEERQHLQVLGFLPEKLRADISAEWRGKHLHHHNFFAFCQVRHPRFVRQLCHSAMREEFAAMRSEIFNFGDGCTKMLFVTRGLLDYEATPQGPYSSDKSGSSGSGSPVAGRSGSPMAAPRPSLLPQQTNMTDLTLSWHNLSPKADFGSAKMGMSEHLCEACLWTYWQNVGRLHTISSCVLLELDAQSLLTEVQQYSTARPDIRQYANLFVSCINKHHGTLLCTDRGVNMSGVIGSC